MILALLYIAGDVVARMTVESQLETRLAQEVPEAAGADVSVNSFPFLLRLLLSGDVSGVTGTVADLRTDRVTFDFVSVDLRNVRINRGALVSDRQLELEGVGGGTATAELTQAELSRALDVPIVLSPGQVGVRVAGRTVSASVAIRDGALVFGGVGLSLPRLNVPQLPLLTCDPTAEVLEGRVRLSCTVDTVPEELLREAQRQVG